MIPFLLIPVFLTYRPNSVGYETIINTDLNDPAIKTGDKLACNFALPNGDHRLIEGKLLMRKPLIMLVDTSLFKTVLLYVNEHDIEFCLTPDQGSK